MADKDIYHWSKKKHCSNRKTKTLKQLKEKDFAKKSLAHISHVKINYH